MNISKRDRSLVHLGVCSCCSDNEALRLLSSRNVRHSFQLDRILLWCLEIKRRDGEWNYWPVECRVDWKTESPDAGFCWSWWMVVGSFSFRFQSKQNSIWLSMKLPLMVRLGTIELWFRTGSVRLPPKPSFVTRAIVEIVVADVFYFFKFGNRSCATCAASWTTTGKRDASWRASGSASAATRRPSCARRWLRSLPLPSFTSFQPMLTFLLGLT